MKYYPFVKNWKKIKPLIESESVQKIMVADFNKFTYGMWKKRFVKGMRPRQFEGCDWGWDRKGRRPEYWEYVKHAACHWLVNYQLELARLVSPKRQWRIITSQDHSTVWDGQDTLFDMNFSALQVPADEAFKIANKKEMPIGKPIKVYEASPIK